MLLFALRIVESCTPIHTVSVSKHQSFIIIQVNYSAVISYSSFHDFFDFMKLLENRESIDILTLSIQTASIIRVVFKSDRMCL